MIKPIWAAVGGLALLGTAVGVGALVVASTGGEEEAAFEPKSTAVPATIAPEQVMIDAFTGQLVSAGPDDDPVFEKREEIAPALNTVSICPFDPAAAPWPYTGAAPEGPRLTLGKLTFLQPDPSSGVQWSFQSA